MLHPVVVLPRVLLLVLALAHATGVVELVRRQVCEVECRSDGCDADCTPGSGAPSCPCHCPSLPTHLASPITTVAIVPATRTAPPFDSDDGLHPSPDPREIAHVPRRTV